MSAILDGLRVTLGVAALSVMVASVLGVLGAACKLGVSPVLKRGAGLYITIIRGIPELVLMLLVFYGGQAAVNVVELALGLDYIDVNPFVAGVLTLGFIFGAYLTETFRGAILAVPRGQAEAGRALGLRPMQVRRLIVAPQTVRHALPGFTNTLLVMVKATALVSVIGLDDMVNRAGLAASATREPFTFYGALGLIDLVTTSVSPLALAALARRFPARA